VLVLPLGGDAVTTAGAQTILAATNQGRILCRQRHRGAIVAALRLRFALRTFAQGDTCGEFDVKALIFGAILSIYIR
jgi:hypothetical protein